MKYGLECEFFVAKKNVIQEGQYAFVGGLDASLTPDECGFLAEARGKPYDNIREAVFSLMADVHRLALAADKLDLQLVQVPRAVVPYSEILKARRQYAKGTIQFQNLYGFESHKEKRQKTAGVHISFTDGREFDYKVRRDNCEESRVFKYQPIWDFVQLFRHLDKEFKQEIKEANRNPGFYEIKPDGRVEYRSLPNTVDLMKVIKVVEDWHNKK